MGDPWYRSSFSSAYLELYAHRDQDEGNRDIERATQLAHLNRDSAILDLCCGAGRHLIALSQLGFSNLTGLDLSTDLLAQASKDLEKLGIAARLIEADMRKIPADSRYDVILSLFTSFGYFVRDDENRSVLEGAISRLNHNGVMVMDTINPAYLRNNLVPQETKLIDGRTIDIKRIITTEVPRVEKKTIISENRTQGTATTEYLESVRLFTPDEMQSLYRTSGFSSVEIFGSFEGDPLTDLSPRMVIRARP